MRSSLVTGIAAVLLVTILGGLAGWYAYLRTHATAIRASDTARGFTSGADFLGLGSGGTSAGGILSANPGVTSGVGDSSATSSSSATSTSRVDTLSDSLSATGEAVFSAATPPTTPRFWKAGKTPVAGFAFVTVNGHPLLQYVERATGNIFSMDPWSGNTERLTNTLHPKTAEAYFADSAVIERSLSEKGIETVTGTIGRTATTSAYIFSALENNILSAAANPSLNGILYVRPNGSGSDIVMAAADGSRQKVIYSSPLSNWKTFLIPGHTIIAQRPGDGIPGYAFEVTKNGLKRILGDIPGLEILPRASSTALIWSSSSAEGTRLFTQPNATSTAVQVSLRTYAEKCAWAPQDGSLTAYCAVPHGALPRGFLDQWHQGASFTSDAFWQVDASAGSSQALYTSDDDVDVRNPQVDQTGTFLAFINGRDDSLWVLRIHK